MLNKKILTISALIAFFANTATADEGTYYLTASVGEFKSSKVNPSIDGIKMSNKEDMSAIAFLGGGYNFNKYFRIEVPLVFARPQYQNGTRNDVIGGRDFHSTSIITTSYFGAMINGYGTYEINDTIEAFVGAGIGGGYLNSKIKRLFGLVEDKKLKPISTRIHKSKNQPQIAWNLSTGMGFRIGNVGKLDVKYQYISLGKIRKRGKDSDLVLGAAKLAKSLPINGHVVTVGFRRDL